MIGNLLNYLLMGAISTVGAQAVIKIEHGLSHLSQPETHYNKPFLSPVLELEQAITPPSPPILESPQ